MDSSIDARGDKRKSIGRRVSFAPMAHVRLYPKGQGKSGDKDSDSDEDGDGACDSPIAGLALGQAASLQARTIPDLSSVRRGSDAFNLRLSLDPTNSSEQGDMSICSDSDTSKSINNSFEVSLKDASLGMRHDGDNSDDDDISRRESVFPFFNHSAATETEDSNDDDMENTAPMELKSPSKRQTSSLPKNLVLQSSPAVIDSREHEEVSEPEDVEMEDSSFVMQENEADSKMPATSNSRDKYRHRDSIAPFFGKNTDSDAEDDEEMDSDMGSRNNGLPVSRGTSSSSNELDQDSEDMDLSLEASLTAGTEFDSTAKILGSASPAEAVANPSKYRARDSVAPFFPTIHHEDNQQNQTAENPVNYRARDSIANFFKPCQDEDDLPETKPVNYRSRDSVGTFFPRFDSEAAEDGGSEIGTPAPPVAKVNYPRDSVAFLFPPKSGDLEDESMDLAEDSSFIQAQNLPIQSGTSLLQDSEAEDSFGDSNVQDMELTTFRRNILGTPVQPKMQETESRSTITTPKASFSQSSSTPKSGRRERNVRGTPSHESSQTSSQTERETGALTQNDPPPDLVASTPKGKSSSVRRSGRRSSIHSVSKLHHHAFAPHMSSPLSKSKSMPEEPDSEPDSPLRSNSLASKQKLGLDSRASPVRSSPRLASRRSSEAPLQQQQLQSLPIALPRTVSASTPKASARKSLSSALVDTPKLANFMKTLASGSKKNRISEAAPAAESLMNDEDNDMDDAGIMDTFNKPSEMFKKALGGKMRASDYKLREGMFLPYLSFKVCFNVWAPFKDDVVVQPPEEELMTDQDMAFNSQTSGTDIVQTALAAQADEPSGNSEESQEQRMTLNEFLQVTGLHFIDGLSTTLRRETSAFSSNANENGPSALDYTKAACLYQPELVYYESACASLISYVDEGRQTMRMLETDIVASTPPLFYEYAAADDMDRDRLQGQLKSLKSLARLKTKEEWYIWRKDMLEPFRVAIGQNVESCDKDLRKICEYQLNLDSVLPAAMEHLEGLEKKKDELMRKFNEVRICDPEKLEASEVEHAELSTMLLELPQKIQQQTELLAKEDMEIERTRAETKSMLEEIRLLNAEYEQLCDQMPDDVVGIQDNNRLVQEITGWKVLGHRSEGATNPCLEFDGFAQISLSLPYRAVPVPKFGGLLMHAAPAILSGISSVDAADMAHLPKLMNQIEISSSRLKILLGDLDDAARECSISDPEVKHDQLVAVAMFSNFTRNDTPIRFSVEFSFDLKEIVYPYGRINSSVRIYYGTVSEEQVLRVIASAPRRYDRLRSICKELRQMVE
ncbi:hypothetical protein HDU81_005604 [Chytriomyces hyalinus]|nr:hypothetical protein HDU81_005604 [Chytriomyces hyalinus]